MNKFVKNHRETIMGGIWILLIATGSFIIVTSWIPSKAGKEEVTNTLYRDGITPALNSDDSFTGEVVKITTPTASKVVMLGVRQLKQPGEVIVANAIFFAIGDETMLIGEKVRVQKYWHVPHDQLAQSYCVWLASKLGTNQVAEKK